MREPVPVPDATADGGPLEPALESLLGSEDPTGAFEVILELLRARSLVRVGLALLARFPTEEDQQRVFEESEFLAAAARFGAVRTTLRDAQQSADAAALVAATGQTYPQAIEAVAVLADRLGCEAEDLVSVMLGA